MYYNIKEKITQIKMDIEGMEELAIKCKNGTPKLLISVYHNHHDLWKIPKLSNYITYHYYLRYFSNKYYQPK